MARPRPVPFPVRLRVKNGSKMFSSTSAGMPQPVSANSISAMPSRCRSRMVSRPPSSMLSRALTTRLSTTDLISSALTQAVTRPPVHVVQSRGQVLQLVAAVDLDPVLEVALGHPAGAPLQVADRVEHPAVEEAEQTGHQQHAQQAGGQDDGQADLVILLGLG